MRTGVDTTFVAPVEVGDDAYTGAGSVITEDVPPGALGISRAEQKNVEGYAEKKAKESSEGEGLVSTIEQTAAVSPRSSRTTASA